MQVMLANRGVVNDGAERAYVELQGLSFSFGSSCACCLSRVDLKRQNGWGFRMENVKEKEVIVQ